MQVKAFFSMVKCAVVEGILSLPYLSRLTISDLSPRNFQHRSCCQQGLTSETSLNRACTHRDGQTPLAENLQRLRQQSALEVLIRNDE